MYKDHFISDFKQLPVLESVPEVKFENLSLSKILEFFTDSFDILKSNCIYGGLVRITKLTLKKRVIGIYGKLFFFFLSFLPSYWIQYFPVFLTYCFFVEALLVIKKLSYIEKINKSIWIYSIPIPSSFIEADGVCEYIWHGTFNAEINGEKKIN